MGPESDIRLFRHGDPQFRDFGVICTLVGSFFPLENVEAGLFSRITMTSMTSAWYLRLSHFEALLLGLLVLQVFVMRYFLILPLDITKLIEDGTLLGTSVSRRKRSYISDLDIQEIVSQQRLAESMFSVIRRLDRNDCVLRSLCELGENEKRIKLSKGISELLLSLKKLGRQRIREESLQTSNNITLTERKVLSAFEDAVLLGSGDIAPDLESNSKAHNFEISLCERHYTLCTAENGELLGYVSKIQPFLL